MRKLVVFLVFMNFLLLGGGQYLNASTTQNSFHHHLEKRHRVKFLNQDQTNSIIEDADVDLEEDCLDNDNLKSVISNRLFATYTLLDRWYLTFSDQAVATSNQNFDTFGSFSSQSNPIYITQRVLRI